MINKVLKNETEEIKVGFYFQSHDCRQLKNNNEIFNCDFALSLNKNTGEITILKDRFKCIKNKEKRNQKRYVIIITNSGTRWNSTVSYSRKSDAERAKKRIVENILGVPWKDYLSVRQDI